jgi:hypothetical protein
MPASVLPPKTIPGKGPKLTPFPTAIERSNKMGLLSDDDVALLWEDAAQSIGARYTRWCANIGGTDYLDHLPEDVMTKPHGLDLSLCRTIAGDNGYCSCCLMNLPMPFIASEIQTLADLWALVDRWRSRRPHCDHTFIEEMYLCENDSTQLLVSFGS